MNSKLTKLFRPYGVHDSVNCCAQIHSNHYGDSLDHILEMANELKKDFPFIQDSDIHVQKYGGRRIKGITFVEVFINRKIKMPKGYEKVREIEYILG